MNSEKWIDHLTRWKEFLDVRLSYAKDDGEREKTTRQLSAGPKGLKVHSALFSTVSMIALPRMSCSAF